MTAKTIWILYAFVVHGPMIEQFETGEMCQAAAKALVEATSDWWLGNVKDPICIKVSP